MDQDFDRNLFVLLHDVARLTRVAADKRARVHGMTRAQWALMSRLARNPGLSQKELADLLEVEPISVARMVDRLEANNMLERRADANDRRIWRLHLLPGAEPTLKRMTALGEELSRQVSQNVPPAVREAMLDGLIQMKANILQLEPDAAQPAATPGAEQAQPNAAQPDPLREIA
jgi:MarR family transcriptional regulator, transcriptional regulator for hemolysin